MTTFVVKTIDGLRDVIENFPDEMNVKVAEGIGITSATVGELRALEIFPSGQEELRVVTPREPYPESVVKIELVD